jgi:putative transposase
LAMRCRPWWRAGLHVIDGGARTGIIQTVLAFLRALMAGRTELAAENVALRHQLAVLQRSVKRPKLRKRDPVFWVWLSRLWTDWRSALAIVQPATVIKWHRQGFRLYWRRKARRKAGRPQVARKIRDLIRRISRENPTWGAPRILSELLLLGHKVGESTVTKYMIRQPKPPSQTWRTFLENHAGQIAAIDFFTVPTVTFRVLYVFLVLRRDRRHVVHLDVRTNPTAQWTAQQIVEAFPFEEAPRFLLRDRDRIYGQSFRDRVEHMGIEEVRIAFRSPWQSPYVERLIGSIRRECLDYVIVFNEKHLRRVLAEYFDYYHEARAHLSLERNSPIPRVVCPPAQGKVVARACLGGLHHRYTRAA